MMRRLMDAADFMHMRPVAEDGETTRVVPLKLVGRGHAVRDMATEYMALGCPEVVDTEASDPDYLAALMSVVAAFWGLSRAPLSGSCPEDAAWRGPGVYRVGVEFGLSQSQDWDKLDDGCVKAGKIGEPTW